MVAVDRDPEAPGFALADRAVVASTHDADEVLRVTRAAGALEVAQTAS